MYMLFMIGMDLMPVSIIDDTLKEKRSRSLSFAQSYNSPPYPLIFMGGSYPEFVELRWNYLASDKSEPNDLIHIEKYLMRKLESLHCEQLLKSLQLGMLYSHIRILVPDRSLLNQKLPKKVAARGSCLIPIK